uniref:TTF-type domain-containing protein n=1 Tax=Paramormyrops kingsleyae TaxID=1676925 RepID=A0A3B3R2M6_9TELE
MSDPLKFGAVSQASTDSTHPERDPVHGPKMSANFIEVGPFQPIISFPSSDGRKFRKEWYAIYEWLKYSPALDRAFCFTCRAFGELKTDTFQVTGFGNWRKATEKFNEHQKSSVHISAGLKMKGYQQTRKTGSVATQISSEHAKRVDENREYLKKICETLLFCCRSCIALRGHDETEESQNRGNFLELMDLRANDSQLINRLFKKRERSFNYVHSMHQNELINIMAGQVKSDIIQKVLEAGIFALIADEAQDISRHEQVAVVLRYVDGDLAMVNLAILLKNVLTSFNLERNLRAQCYDGAASMRGTYRGVAARILHKNPLAIHVLCHSHILNLCIVDVCQRNSDFSGKSTTLKHLSDTRWSCRAEALKAILDNFETIVDTLSEISEKDVQIGGQANSLLTSVTDFHFLFPCILMRRVLMQCNVLSKALQSSTLHYASVKNLVSATISALLAMRTDHHFQQPWEFTVQLCDKNNYRGPQRPWRRTNKTTMPGPNADSAQDHYKDLHFSVLDNTGSATENLYMRNLTQIYKAIFKREKEKTQMIRNDTHQEEPVISPGDRVHVQVNSNRRGFRIRWQEMQVNTQECFDWGYNMWRSWQQVVMKRLFLGAVIIPALVLILCCVAPLMCTLVSRALS